jgi:FkbM family methyltransferase
LFILYISTNQFLLNVLSHFYSVIYSQIFNLIGWTKCKKIDSNKLECSDGNKKFYCSIYDTIVSANLRAGIPWEGFMHKYFKTYSNKNKIALDIGANIGTHTVYLSDYFGKVHAFEPQTSVFNLLESNIKLNACTNVKTHKFGLGDKNITENMEKYDLTKPNNQGAIAIDKTGTSNGEQIEVRILDELGLSNIGFMKIDVEGYELYVLKGAINTIKTNKPIIIIELNDKTKDDRAEIVKLLTNLNYNLKQISSDDWICLPN